MILSKTLGNFIKNIKVHLPNATNHSDGFEHVLGHKQVILRKTVGNTEQKSSKILESFGKSDMLFLSESYSADTSPVLTCIPPLFFVL